VIAALTDIEKNYPDAMVMMNSAGAYQFPVWNIGWKVLEFGGAVELGGIPYVPFTFVGSVGRIQGTAPLSRWGSTRTVTGYLAPDSRGNYAFMQTDFVRYDLKMNGDITVGAKTYTVASSYRVNCDGQNAFHLVVVNREDPTTAYASNTYCTAASNFEIQRIIGDINTLTSNLTDETRLVLLGSNGKPIPADWNFTTDGDSRFYPLAQQVRELGGYWETMVYLTPNDTYSLVGAPPPPAGTRGAQKRAREYSSVYPEISAGVRPSGELHGVLARSGRGNWYSPLNADPTGQANLGFYEALAETPAHFPHPAGAAEVAAYQYISSKLCSGCNIRDLYDNLNVGIGSYKTTLEQMTDAKGLSCGASGSEADSSFCTVRGQLLTEFQDVINIRTFYDNLQNLWLGTGSVTILSQLNAYNEVKAQLPVPPTAPSQSLTTPLVRFFLGLGKAVPQIGPLFGIADVAFNFATLLTTTPQGNETIDLTSTIGNLQQQAIDQFTAQQTTTGTFFQLIYQDWGKLHTLGTALATQPDRDSPWYWSSNATGLMLNQLTPAIREAAYQNLMAAAYAIGSYYPNTPRDGHGWGLYPVSRQPHGYVVIVNRRAPSVPTSTPFNIPSYIPFTYPTDLGNQWASDPRTSTLLTDNAWLGISALNTPAVGTFDEFQYSPPSEALRSLLFNPLWKDGLGVYRPAFFHSWPFRRVKCDPSFGNRGNGGTWVGSCDWSAGAPAPEQLEDGAPLTSVTMRAIVTSAQEPRPPQVDVLLTIHNNGTSTAETVTIDSITIGTLAGAGQATLLSPTLPIVVKDLQPGDATSMFLKIDVPAGAAGISVSEQGAVTAGGAQSPTEFKFNEAQVLIM
jgi:hypothetical protein